MNKKSGNPQESIERSPHDNKNPYSMIRNDLIKNKKLSTNCRFLLVFILTHIDSVKLSGKFLCNILKGSMSKNKVYECINEAISHGYMKREMIKENNLIRYKLYISESGSFKKSFRFPVSGDPEASDPLTNNNLNQVYKEPTPTPSLEPEPPDKGFFDKSSEEEEVLGLWIQDRTGCDEERARAVFWNAKSFEVRKMLKKDKESFIYKAINNNYTLRASFHEKNRCIAYAAERNCKGCFTDRGMLIFDFTHEKLAFTSKDFIDRLINIIKTYKVESLAKYFGINL